MAAHSDFSPLRSSAGPANRLAGPPRLRAHKGRSRACQWQRPPALQCASASHGGVRGRVVNLKGPRGVPGPLAVDVPSLRLPGTKLAGCPVTAPASQTVRPGVRVRRVMGHVGRGARVEAHQLHETTRHARSLLFRVLALPDALALTKESHLRTSDSTSRWLTMILSSTSSIVLAKVTWYHDPLNYEQAG